jgi:hypothetical protein
MHRSLSQFIGLAVTIFAATALFAAPSITSLSPTSGASGLPVVITGSGFGSTQGGSTVQFGNVVASVTNWSSSARIKLRR